MENINISLLQGVINHQKELVVIFHKDEVLLTNKKFNNFFDVVSTKEFKSNFKLFIDNFIPHPYYFHKEKMAKGESWFDAILKLPKDDRTVSMITPNYEPHAFSVDIDNNIDDFKIVTFTDITQDLIKRIMIENNASIDRKSGAYAKKYFTQIAKSYEYAAKFNEKYIAVILITLKNQIKDMEFVNSFKNIIREDDMLIKWDENSFLLVYLVDSIEKAPKMLSKLQKLITIEPLNEFRCELKINVQEENENIKSLIKRV